MRFTDDCTINPNFSRLANLAGEAAAFEKPSVPEPLIEPNAVAAQDSLSSRSFANGEFSSFSEVPGFSDGVCRICPLSSSAYPCDGARTWSWVVHSISRIGITLFFGDVAEPFEHGAHHPAKA